MYKSSERADEEAGHPFSNTSLLDSMAFDYRPLRLPC